MDGSLAKEKLLEKQKNKDGFNNIKSVFKASIDTQTKKYRDDTEFVYASTFQTQTRQDIDELAFTKALREVHEVNKDQISLRELFKDESTQEELIQDIQKESTQQEAVQAAKQESAKQELVQKAKQESGDFNHFSGQKSKMYLSQAEGKMNLINEARQTALKKILDKVHKCIDKFTDQGISLQDAIERTQEIEDVIGELNAFANTGLKFSEKRKMTKQDDLEIRDSIKDLAAQLYIERSYIYYQTKEAQYEREENEALKKQAEADAKASLYQELVSKVGSEKTGAEEKLKEHKQDAPFTIEELKNKKLIEENNRQSSKFSEKIKDKDSQTEITKALFQSHDNMKGFSSKTASASYMSMVAQRANQMRLGFIDEWLGDNFEQIRNNIKEISAFITQKPAEGEESLESKIEKIELLSDFKVLLSENLKDDNMSKYIGEFIKIKFARISMSKKDEQDKIPEKLLEFIAAQAVLFEKRTAMIKEKELVKSAADKKDISDEAKKKEQEKKVIEKKNDLAFQDNNNEEAMKKLAEEERARLRKESEKRRAKIKEDMDARERKRIERMRTKLVGDAGANGENGGDGANAANGLKRNRRNSIASRSATATVS